MRQHRFEGLRPKCGTVLVCDTRQDAVCTRETACPARNGEWKSVQAGLNGWNLKGERALPMDSGSVVLSFSTLAEANPSQGLGRVCFCERDRKSTRLNSSHRT